MRNVTTFGFLICFRTNQKETVLVTINKNIISDEVEYKENQTFKTITLKTIIIITTTVIAVFTKKSYNNILISVTL
jgi:hypothetical protein